MQYKNIENYDLVKEALIEANRRDLIGFGPECLIPPRPIGRNNRNSQSIGSRNGGRKTNDCRNGRQSSEKISKGRPSRNGVTKGRPSNSNRGRGSR